MSARTISGVIHPGLFENAQHAADYEGLSMSALVSSALTLYLGLPAAARRTARHVIGSGSDESRAILTEGCGRAIAQAGDAALTAKLAERGRAMGLHNEAVSEEDLAEEAVTLVRAARQTARRLTQNGTQERQALRG